MTSEVHDLRAGPCFLKHKAFCFKKTFALEPLSHQTAGITEHLAEKWLFTE